MSDQKDSCKIIDVIRDKLDMNNDADVAAWELLNEINRTKHDDLLREFVQDMLNELKELDEQILTIEKQRLSSLNNKVLRTQCREILTRLLKDRDGLRQTLGSETYKRMATELSRGAVQSRR